MKIAVISDVHGNRFALEAVLDDIARQGVDLTVNLGDVVAGPIDPQGTAERLMAAGLPTIRGNHDRTCLGDRSKMERVHGFAHDALVPAQRDWLAQLPATLVIEGIYLCHGTPQSDTEPWLDTWYTDRNTTLPSEAEVARKADGLDYPVLVCGHTHIPRLVRLRDGRMIFNPGSVGLQLIRGAPDARYGILERRDGRWQAGLRMLPYDTEAAAKMAEANGFAPWRDALVSGRAEPKGLFN